MSQVAARYIVNIEVKGLNDKVDALRRQLDKNVLMSAIGEVHRQWIDENFESEGGNVGGWAPLAESTKAARPKGDNNKGNRKRESGAYGQKILQNTGALRASVTEPFINGHAVSITIGKEYASYHDQGTDPYMIFPKGPWPLRFMGKDGAEVRALWVHHPGLPQRRISPNAEESIDMTKAMIDAAFKRAFG